MTEVISVKFKSRGKTYFFDPAGKKVPDNIPVVVETAKGLELADCVKGNHYTTDESIVPPLRPVVRIATADDMRIAELCKTREKEAFGICEEKIAQHGLDMKLVDVECNFEGNKILFFFTSDGRVDFRELVKDLAGIFRTRIELRQIGVRDEAKMLGGLGICGRPFCCHQFLDDFQPVSTKMAKTQSLSLNPAKISGTCGRLMCCLRYEQEAYEDLVKTVPKNGAFVETPVGYGNVTQVNLLRQKVKVAIDGEDNGLKTFEADEVAAVPGGRPKPGEPLPHVLVLKPKKVEEPEETFWKAPDMFAPVEAKMEITEPQNEEKSEEKSSEQHKRNRRRRDRSRGEGQQPKAEQPKIEQQQSKEEKAAGENKPNGNHHRRRHSSKPKAEGENKAPAQEKPVQAKENRPARPQNNNHKPKQNQAKPVPEKKPSPAPQSKAEGEQKSGDKPNRRPNHHRRHHSSKPKAEGENKQ